MGHLTLLVEIGDGGVEGGDVVEGLAGELMALEVAPDAFDGVQSAGIAPLKTEADYRAMLTEIESLMHIGGDCPEGDRPDMLATLVEDYERKHLQIEAPGPIEAIKFMMEQKGFSRPDLEPVIGSRGRVSEVLNRKRRLTVKMIREL